MKIIINTSTFFGTGITQVAVSFIQECREIPGNVYFVFLSKTVRKEIDLDDFPSNFHFIEIDVHPKFLIKGSKTREKLRELERKIEPDCVFSVFGPSYWSPSSIHLQGYAHPHYIYPESPFFSLISLKSRFYIELLKKAHRYLMRRNGKYFVCETTDVSERASKFLNLPKSNFYTVSNTFNNYFEKFDCSDSLKLPPKEKNEFRFLVLCSFAPHKNLEILNKVIPLLIKRIKNKKLKFILTVDEGGFEEKFLKETKESIINLGRIEVSQCPQLYFECDALFAPTLLECFSANYPEAMKMERPILTSNLSFAVNICQKAALYFDPLDPNDIVEKMENLIGNPSMYCQLVEEGKKRLSYFSSSKERAKQYLQICEELININK